MLTHGHLSHLGGLATLERLSGAAVYSREWEADIIAGERPAQPVTIVPMLPLRTYWRVYYLQFGAALGRGKHPPCPVDSHVEDGDTVPRAGAPHARPQAGSPRLLVTRTSGSLRRRRHRHLSGVRGGLAFNLNPTRQRASVSRMAQLEAEVVAVGQGDPTIAGAAERLHSLAEGR